MGIYLPRLLAALFFDSSRGTNTKQNKNLEIDVDAGARVLFFQFLTGNEQPNAMQWNEWVCEWSAPQNTLLSEHCQIWNVNVMLEQNHFTFIYSAFFAGRRTMLNQKHKTE